MEDSQIVSLYWQRKERAIKETEAKYGRYCYRIAHNILEHRQDAEECVSDTYLAAWNAIPPHRPSILQTFLGKITRRISLNRWRWEQTQKRGAGQVPLALEELAECISGGFVKVREMVDMVLGEDGEEPPMQYRTIYGGDMG